MERVYWKFKLEESYYYQSDSILFYLSRLYLLFYPLDSLLFYQEEPAILKELYTDTVVEFDLRYATVEENGKERSIYPVHFHIPDTNVYYSRTMHYLKDPNQRFTQLDETDLKNEIGSDFFDRIKMVRDQRFNIQYNLIQNYFLYLYSKKKIEDEELEYVISHNHPKDIKADQWDHLKRYLFYFSSKQTQERRKRKMEKRNQKNKENSIKFVERFFSEYKS